MGKFDGVLLASDFDNTLVFTEEALEKGLEIPPVSLENREALTCFMAQGGRFAVSTGRALPSFRAFAPQVPMNVPGVVCNGAALFDFAADRYLYTAFLDKAALDRVDELLPRFPQLGCEVYHESNVIHAVQANDFTRSHLSLSHATYLEVESLHQIESSCLKLLFEGERESLDALRNEMTAQGWAGEYELIYSSSHLLEMTAKGANKGGMVLRLAALLGLSPAQLYCVGDHANDIPMLEVAAQAFAPANCIDAVKALPGIRLVSHCGDSALADVVEILDKKYS